jgi:hypothetical protein
MAKHLCFWCGEEIPDELFNPDDDHHFCSGDCTNNYETF